MRIETARGAQESLSAQHIVDARQAAAKSVCRVENRGVGVRQSGVPLEPLGGEVASTAGLLDLGEEFHGALRPDAPLAQQPPGNESSAAAEAKRREQIHDDVVVVAGIEGDILAAGRTDGANDVERLVAVERRDLDRHHLGNLGKRAPEPMRKDASAHGRLQVEPDQRDLAGDLPAMLQDGLLRIPIPRAEAQESGGITQIAGEPCFPDRLGGAAAKPGNQDEPVIEAGVGRGGGGQFEHRSEQAMRGIADRELRRVHAHGHTAGARGGVVAYQGALMPLVPATAAIEREGQRREHLSLGQVRAELRGAKRTDHRVTKELLKSGRGGQANYSGPAAADQVRSQPARRRRLRSSVGRSACECSRHHGPWNPAARPSWNAARRS